MYTQLSAKEREQLYLKKQTECSLRMIGREMERSPSTLSRELKRNTLCEDWGYLPDSANQKAFDRKARHGKKLKNNPELKEYVITKLKSGCFIL